MSNRIKVVGLLATATPARYASRRRMKKMNRRQQKKLRLGPFQELGFEVSVTYKEELDLPLHQQRSAAFWDALIPFVESRQLAVGGSEDQFFVTHFGRGTVTEDDAKAVIDRLLQMDFVADAKAGALVDAWY